MQTKHSHVKIICFKQCFKNLCLQYVGFAGVPMKYLLCVHIAATTLGLKVTSVQMAKVNTQCSQPSPRQLSVKDAADRDLDQVENGLGR